MKGFIRNILLDAFILWPAIIICIFNLKHSDYAENLLSFYGIILLVTGLLAMLSPDKLINESTPEKVKPKFRTTYSVASCFIECLVFASLGWYWVATGVLVACAATVGIDNRIRDKHKAI